MSKCSVSDGHVHFSSMLSLTILKMLRNSVLFQQKETLRAVFFHFFKEIRAIFGNEDASHSEQTQEL